MPAAAASLRGRDLLSSADLSADEVCCVLDRADALKDELRREGRHAAMPLAGRTVAVISEKQTLRTRVTFETGIFQLGGHAVVMGAEIGLGTRESVSDVARNLDRWVDAIVIRTFGQAIVEEMAQVARIPVINALTDEEHPCQALADLMTLRERFNNLAGLRLAFVGDGHNMYASLALSGAIAGIDVRLAHPPGYGPRPAILARARALAAASGGRIVVCEDPRDAVAEADAIYTDVWVSMDQRSERAERLKAFEGYRVDDALVACAAPHAVVMHCLPAHRGEEIDSATLDGFRSVAFDQAENRLHAQKAFLVESIGA